MNSYLKKAIERDTRTPQAISPISKMDGEIFFEITELLKKLGQVKIVEQFKKYKKIKDSSFYELMLDINTNSNLYIEENISKIEEKYQEKPKTIPRVFVSIKDNEFTIDVFRLRSIQKYKQYNSNKFIIEYFILINNSERIDLDSNILIGFDTEKERDEEIKILKEKLSTYNITFAE